MVRGIHRQNAINFKKIKVPTLHTPLESSRLGRFGGPPPPRPHRKAPRVACRLRTNKYILNASSIMGSIRHQVSGAQPLGTGGGLRDVPPTILVGCGRRPANRPNLVSTI